MKGKMKFHQKEVWYWEEWIKECEAHEKEKMNLQSGKREPNSSIERKLLETKNEIDRLLKDGKYVEEIGDIQETRFNNLKKQFPELKNISNIEIVEKAKGGRIFDLLGAL